MTHQRAQKFSLKYFRVIRETEGPDAELVPRLNRQISKAVQRNRIKRILREFYRRNYARFKGARWVFIAKPSVETAANKQVWDDLDNVLQRMGKKNS